MKRFGGWGSFKLGAVKLKYLIFRFSHTFYSIPFSEIQKPRVRAFLKGAIIVETQQDLLGYKTVNYYRIKRKKPSAIRQKRKSIYRKYKPMNLGLQRSILERHARRHGVATDILDWDRMDNTLSFGENRRTMTEQIRRLSGRDDIEVERIEKTQIPREMQRYISNLTHKWDSGHKKELRGLGIRKKKDIFNAIIRSSR